MATDWSEERPTIDLVKATVTVPEVAEMLGFEPNSQDKIPSFQNPDERTPSLHLYEDHWYDYSAGVGGDVFDLIAAYEPGVTLNEAVRLIWKRALRAGKEPGDVEHQPVRQVKDFTEELPGHMTVEQWSGWQQLLGVVVPLTCRVSEDGDLLIPHADRDGVYGVKVRTPAGAKSAWPGSQFTKRLYHPFGWVVTPGRNWNPAGIAVIAEGESDSWALASRLPADVFALPSGAQSWKDSWLEDLKPYSDVLLAMDNDKTGQEALTKLLAKIPNSRRLEIPQLAKDVRDALAKFPGWNPAEQL